MGDDHAAEAQGNALAGVAAPQWVVAPALQAIRAGRRPRNTNRAALLCIAKESGSDFN